MKSLNIDQLLDQDTLSPAEERFVRKMVIYELIQKKGNIELEFSIKEEKQSVNAIYTIIFNDLIKDRIVVYKYILFRLITNFARIATNDQIINQVKEILRSGNPNVEAPIETLYFGPVGSKFNAHHYETIRIKELYRALILIKNN